MTSSKVFISYTKADRKWAAWIGCTLRDAGHTPFVYEWELPVGGNIPAWMEKRLGEADRAIGVFSDDYCAATFSSAERNASIWRDEYGETGFFIPVEVRKVARWPVFTAPLVRISLLERSEAEAEELLLAALEPPKAPDVRPPFPGVKRLPTGGMGRATAPGVRGTPVFYFKLSKIRRVSDFSPAVDPAVARLRRAAAHGDIVLPEAESLPAARPGFPAE